MFSTFDVKMVNVVQNAECFCCLNIKWSTLQPAAAAVSGVPGVPTPHLLTTCWCMTTFLPPPRSCTWTDHLATWDQPRPGGEDPKLVVVDHDNSIFNSLFIVISAKSTKKTLQITKYHVASSVDEPPWLQRPVLMSSSSRSPGQWQWQCPPPCLSPVPSV